MWNLDFEKIKIKKRDYSCENPIIEKQNMMNIATLTEILIKHFKSATQIKLP